MSSSITLRAFTVLALLAALAACRVSCAPPINEPDPAAQAADTTSYIPYPEEMRLGELLTTSTEQKRDTLRWNETLARVARARALDMARQGYFSHTTREGWGANRLVEQAGYRLPAFYDAAKSGNSIESIGRGYATPESVWRQWMGSQRHRAHLLGLDPVFARQTEYGIGYARVRGPARDHVWVVLIARPGS